MQPNAATQEQRNLLRQYERALRRRQDGPIQRARKFLKSNSRSKATAMVIMYFFIFAVSFQASKADFEQNTSKFLEANNQTDSQSVSTQRATSALAKATATPTPVATTTSESITLPATDRPSEDAPSNGMQYTASGYSYGQCTWYVSHRRPIPQNWGNARDWVLNAKNAGFTAGPHARPGAIGQTTAGRYGHVVYVEQVQDGKVYVSEMNYVGWNRLSYRWANESEFTYIY